MSRTRSQKRPWLAALLAMLQPGLGHFYLRQWSRALLWFSFLFVTSQIFMPESVVQAQQALFTAFQTGDFGPYYETTQSLSSDAVIMLLPIASVWLFNVVDAYWTALQSDRAHETTERCPSCGRPVDDEIDFCKWCTEPLDDQTTVEKDGVISR